VEVGREREVVVEGGNLSAVCSVKGGQPLPELTWLGTEGELLSAGPSLVLTGVTRDRAGVYQCRGDNGYSSEGGLARLELVVEYSPVVEEEETIHSSQGKPVILHCPVEASPEATVTWSREGEEIFPDQSSNTEGVHTLTVNPALADMETPQDIQFTCTATNTRGTNTKTFLVTSKPGQPTFTSSPHSSSEDTIHLEWRLVTDLALESCHLEVTGPETFTLNQTISSSSLSISGPQGEGVYTGTYTLGPGLREGSQYMVRVHGTNSHGQGPWSQWFVVTTATVSASSPSVTVSLGVTIAVIVLVRVAGNLL